jgi:hypothetical protein
MASPDGPEEREADAAEQSAREDERIYQDENRADDPWMPTHVSVQPQGDPHCAIEFDGKPPRGTPKDVHHRITGLARAVLNLMSCEGLSESEYATANEIWALAAILENGREDRNRFIDRVPHISRHEHYT